MNVIYSVKNYVTNVFDLHQGTGSGAVDVVAVQHDDGVLHCSPFHVHFGTHKIQAGRVGKQVALEVNGVRVPGVRMKLGAAGEAFFLAEVHEPVEEEDYRTSPLASPTQYVVQAVGNAVDFPVDDPALDPAGLGEQLHDSLARSTSGTSHVPAESLVDPIAETVPVIDSEHDAPPSEWHDTYRLERTPSTGIGSGGDAGGERLAWGYGALPHMRSSISGQDVTATADKALDDGEDGDAEGIQGEEVPPEQPLMVKSESVYFDAVDSDPSAFGMGRCGDFSSSNSLIDLNPADLEANVPYISLCGHLLGTASSRDEKLSIFASHMVSYDSFRSDPTAILASPNLVALINGQLSAFTPEVQACLISRVLFPYSPPLPLNATFKTRSARVAEFPPRRQPILREIDDESAASKGSTENCLSQTKQRQCSSLSLPALDPVDEVSSEGGASTQDTSSFTTEPYFKKSLLPSQADLRRMSLQAGLNKLSFVVTSVVDQSVVARVDAALYLWPASSKIVIAQIDGAIARTSTGGMFKRRDTSSPLHEGAQAFYSRLEHNGYRIVYLTCQGPTQAEWIRAQLRLSPTSDGSPSADSVAGLPRGPVLLSPDLLLEASSSEVANAQEFKTAALDAVRALFPADVNAFYAAFGQTQEDAVTFERAGVFPRKVFVVDEASGSLRQRSLPSFLESYSSLRVLADSMFPPILSPLAPRSKSTATASASSASRRPSTSSEALVSEAVASQARSRSMADDAYNDVNFWRIEPGTI